MNPLFQQIIIGAVKNSSKNNNQKSGQSKYNSAKNFYKFRVSAIHLLKDSFLIMVGIVSAGFGLKSFLLPNSFIDGGVTGISLLINELGGYPLPILIIVINTPFIFLGLSQIGKSFAIKSAIAIVGLALAITLIPYPIITSDKLLVAGFGGFFIGAGIGFAVRGGGVLDGTEVLAVYISKRTSLTIGDIILIFNVIIFSFAAYVLSIETALYSILTYLAASKTVDFIITGIEEYTGVTIISSHSEEIRLMIVEKLGRGVTMYNGKRGFGKRGERLNSTDIVFTVITRLEVAKLQSEIDKIDPNAFIVMSAIKDTKGGMIKKRPLQNLHK